MKKLVLFAVLAVTCLGLGERTRPAKAFPPQTTGYKCSLDGQGGGWMAPAGNNTFEHTTVLDANTNLVIKWHPRYNSPANQEMDFVSVKIIENGTTIALATYDGPALTSFDFNTGFYAGGTYTVETGGQNSVSHTVEIWYVPPE